MRAELVRVYKSVHTWTGILSGMALFIAFYAGSITLFKPQLARWATPPEHAAVSAHAISLADAPALITRTLASHPEAKREFEIELGRTEPGADLMAWTVQDEGADDHDELSKRYYAARPDADGTVRAVQVERTQVGELIDVLHRVVGLPVDDDVNRYFMGVVAALYFLAMFSGVVILLPSLVKDLFALRIGPNLKRMWLDAHNVVGLGSLPFHIVIALTSTVFAFHDSIYALQNIAVHEGKLGAMLRGAPGAPPSKPLDPAQMLPPSELVARVMALEPEFEPATLRYMRAQGPNPVVYVVGRAPRDLEPRAMGALAILDPYSGRVVNQSYLPGQQGPADVLLTSLFALHFGSFGGKPLKWIYFALGMLGAWLMYSGNLLWIESRIKKAKRHVDAGAIPVQRRDVRWMASATIGVCLGAVCGISLTLLSAKWLHGRVADLNDWHRSLYYLGFFAAVGWSFARGAPRAAVDLLRVAAALTLAIPFTSLLAVLLPSLGPWVHLDALAVDATALGLGAVFAWMARKTARRVHAGRADSVWSLHAPEAPAVHAASEPAAGRG